jgi:hypothetical protein
MAEVTTPSASPTSGGADQGTADQAKEKAREAAGQAQEKAQEAAGQAKGRARQEIDRRSTEAGEQVAGTASDVRAVAEQLRDQGKDKPAQIAEQAADRAERLGGYLKESDADRILGDIEDFGRRQPWAVVAGGLVLGFAASRFLKASSSERYSGRSRGNGSSGTSSASRPGGNGNGTAELTRRATPTEGIAPTGGTFTDPGVQPGGVSPTGGVQSPHAG